MRPQRVAWLVAATLGLVAPVALGWTFGIAIHARVNEHEFTRVGVKSDGCKLSYNLRFTAPESGYSSKSKVRNYHRFRARLLFKNGKAITSEIFANDQPGKRMIYLSHDTEDEACWAKEKVELQDVDVVGCRGKGCKIGQFARVLPDFSH